jgi:hypothetical protein
MFRTLASLYSSQCGPESKNQDRVNVKPSHNLRFVPFPSFGVSETAKEIQ